MKLNFCLKGSYQCNVLKFIVVQAINVFNSLRKNIAKRVNPDERDERKAKIFV